MLDLVLAIAHHLLVFLLFGVLMTEFVFVRAGMDRQTLGRIAAVDLWYGASAGLILVVGFTRAVFAAKGWHFYSHNLFFILKIATFALVGVLSAPPTLA
jgi:putative membrane protein